MDCTTPFKIEYGFLSHNVFVQCFTNFKDIGLLKVNNI